MATLMLDTKFHIPSTRPSLVRRPRLLAQLNEGLGRNIGSDRKLTLISAPAGFGKTTLASEWVDNLRARRVPADGDLHARSNDKALLEAAEESQIVNRVAWLALDEGDSDLGRFLAYFITALSRVDGISATFGESARQMLQSTQPPSEDLLVALLNDVAAIRDRVIFILDDYHSIDSAPIDQALTFLLEHVPPQMHLVVATREDPHLPLARLRASGQLTELRATDLRFTAAEAAEFLTLAMGLNLTQEEIAVLESRTEGWIAGLQLAAISMRGSEDATGLIKSFAGSHRFVLDYLIEEVLQQQSEHVQTFLLYTSILDRLCGPVCDSVTPDSASSGQETLEYLEQANLFIVPLDDERHWYRYHHLFADLLRLRLRQTEPDWEPLLHQRASAWYEQNGFSKEAIDHALHGKDFERAAQVIEEQMEEGFERIDQVTLGRWLAAMPEEFVLSHPLLTILHAWHRFNSGQLDAAERSLQRAEELLAPNRADELLSMQDELQPPRAKRASLMGKIAAVRSFLASFKEDIPLTISYAHQALAHLPEQELGWRSVVFITLGDAYVNQGQMAAAREARANALTTGRASGDIHILMIANLRLAEILRQQGELRQVIELCERQFKQADDFGISESAVVGWLLGIWGEALAERNHLSRAVEQVQRGVELAAPGGDVLYGAMTNLYLVRVLFSSGDISGAQDVVDSMENAAHVQDFPRWILRQLSAWQVRIWLAQDKLESASQWASKSGLDLVGEPTYAHEMEYTALARILIVQGRQDEAEGLLQRLHATAEAGGRTSAVIEISILQALAAQAQRDMGRAIDTLETALSLAEPGGFVYIFVDEGQPMATLLYEALSRGVASAYVQQLLAAFPVDETKQANPSETQALSSESIEPLSEREIEVLQLISEGLTNQEIANRLYLSLNTVKVHNRNIYGKLGVHHRASAVAKARAWGILSSA